LWTAFDNTKSRLDSRERHVVGAREKALARDPRKFGAAVD
jgi:hypothetical protein